MCRRTAPGLEDSAFSMLELVDEKFVERHASDEALCGILGQEGSLAQGRTHKWLQADPAKRAVVSRLYGDLISRRTGLRILDVGGGVSMLTQRLSQRHEFVLVDLLAHDDGSVATAVRATLGDSGFHQSDWWSYTPPAPFDVVIANDLFPNVDQRLTEFLEKFIPHCVELRISLTYYPMTKFYLARRVDGEEILCMRAWDGQQTATVMSHYRSRIEDWDPEPFNAAGSSPFANGRQVCVTSLRGNRADE